MTTGNNNNNNNHNNINSINNHNNNKNNINYHGEGTLPASLTSILQDNILTTGILDELSHIGFLMTSHQDGYKQPKQGEKKSQRSLADIIDDALDIISDDDDMWQDDNETHTSSFNDNTKNPGSPDHSFLKQ
jgi:hypothetical protein